VHGQRDRGPGRLAEVEVRGQVAEDARVLADVEARVGAAVRGGIAVESQSGLFMIVLIRL
jgi:hypothetical protein